MECFNTASLTNHQHRLVHGHMNMAASLVLMPHGIMASREPGSWKHQENLTGDDAADWKRLPFP